MENKDQEKESLYLKIMPYLEKYGILLLLVIMIVVMHFLQPDVFLSWRNVTNVFKQISWQSMLALGVFMVIVTAGIDLSVGSIMMLSLMILAIVAKAGAPWYLGHGRIDLTWLGLEKSQYLPVSLVLIAIVYIIFWIFMNKTRTGKWIYAIGGNPNAARASGINVNKILVIVYSLCGFLSGIGALILAGRTDSGYPNAGLQSELDAIAACIIGGASFFGGRGTVLGVFAGVMIMGILRNGLNLMDVSSFWQQVLIGSIIVLAVYIDVLRRDLGTRK